MPIKWGCCKNVFSLVTFANFWVNSQAKDFFKQHRMFTIGVHFPTLFGYNSSFSTIYRPVHRLNRLLSKSWLWFFLFLFLPKSQKRVYIKNAFVSQKWLFFPHKWFYNNSWHFSNKAEIIQLKNNMVSRQISNKQESMERMKLLQTLNNKNNCFFFFEWTPGLHHFGLTELLSIFSVSPVCLYVCKSYCESIHFPSELHYSPSLANKRKERRVYTHIPLTSNSLTKLNFPLL